MCFVNGELLLDDNDVWIGDIYGCFFLMFNDQFEYWKYMQFMVGIIKGRGFSFLLEILLGICFIICFCFFMDEELEQLFLVRKGSEVELLYLQQLFLYKLFFGVINVYFCFENQEKMGRRKKLKVYIDVYFMGIVDKGCVVGRDVEGKVIFVDGVVLGDVADVLVKCKKKGVFMGMVQEIKFFFFDWVELVCEYFWFCGGCKWQYLSYEVQVCEKEKVVCDIFSCIGKVEIE